MEINKLAQYSRSSFMLELSDIPQQDDENVIDLVRGDGHTQCCHG